VVWDVTGETGLFRLRGHRGQITDLAFLGGSGADKLASSSKDELVKVWDLDTQHCCQTVVCRGGEVWALDVDHSRGDRLAIGAADAELRIYAIDVSESSSEVLREMGSLRRATAERAATLRFAASPDGGTLLICQGAGKVIEIWRRRSEAESRKRFKRRLKRKKEKENKKEDKGVIAEDISSDEVDENAAALSATLSAGDELELVATIRSKHKISSCAICPMTGHKSPSRLVLSLANNSLEIWEYKPGREAARTSVIDAVGHRSDVRAVALSSDDALCLSTSNTGVKIWNPRSGACLRTIEAGYGLCTLFAPGNNHAIVGTKEGTLEILDVRSSSRTATVEGHHGPVWSFALLPDGSGFVSGSADKDVKFWEWELGSGSPAQLGVAHTRTLTMTDDVLCVRVSPDGNLLAIALLDSTVRVFFASTLKFFLSLYGHKLPVLSMDISSDGALLATGSADKNLKIWGLDFGDCHKSLFAHGDSVMAVSFVPGTHYVFTAGKDGAVKYWDADKFDHLLTLEGHHGEVWALVVSSLGDFVLTGSHDRSLRRWERTDEPFFVEEEKERRLESLFEADLEVSYCLTSRATPLLF